MKKLKNFLASNPSYTKWGNQRISDRLNVALSTIVRFKKSQDFKEIKTNYINSLA